MDDQAILLSILNSGIAQCTTVVVEEGGLLAALFMAGLTGSLLHCTGMCGPFVLSQVTARMRAIPAREMREWHRLTGAALLPYHLGRGTTYMILGALAGVLAGTLGGFQALKWVSAGLLVLAALLFLGQALPRVNIHLPGLKGLERGWSNTVGRHAKGLFDSPTGWRGYVLGILLGFIPCGLLYGALAAAASTGGPLAGAMGMGAFTVGTIPALFGVGAAGQFAATRWRGLVERVAPLLLILNAGVLTVLAVQLVV
jgi:sulfite exporter TauE/SafE